MIKILEYMDQILDIKDTHKQLQEKLECKIKIIKYQNEEIIEQAIQFLLEVQKLN